MLNMKMLAANKHSSKLKDMCFEMPNAPYSERYGQVKETTTEWTTDDKRASLKGFFACF